MTGAVPTTWTACYTVQAQKTCPPDMGRDASANGTGMGAVHNRYVAQDRVVGQDRSRVRGQNAAIPVIARPRISAWTSCVPS
jgi:hypothetical protein